MSLRAEVVWSLEFILIQMNDWEFGNDSSTDGNVVTWEIDIALLFQFDFPTFNFHGCANFTGEVQSDNVGQALYLLQNQGMIANLSHRTQIPE